MRPKPALVLALGNDSRGDDALGPLLARRLEAWLEQTGMSADVDIIEDYQLQIEHTVDIADRRLVLFVDAGQGTRSPFAFHEATARRLDGHTTHAVAPEELLGVYARVQRASPPPAFILCLSGLSFELGEPLSATAAAHLERGFDFCRGLFDAPTPRSWRETAKAESTELGRDA
jgi:hydrogenase maturation protease